MHSQTRVGFPQTFPYAHQDAPPFGAHLGDLAERTLLTRRRQVGFDVGDCRLKATAELMWNRRESIQNGARQFFPAVNVANPGNQLPGVGQLAAADPSAQVRPRPGRSTTIARCSACAATIGGTGWEPTTSTSRPRARTPTTPPTSSTTTACSRRRAPRAATRRRSPSPAGCARASRPASRGPRRASSTATSTPDEQAFLFTQEVGNTTYDQQLVEVGVQRPPLRTARLARSASPSALRYRHERTGRHARLQRAQLQPVGLDFGRPHGGRRRCRGSLRRSGVPLAARHAAGRSLISTLSGRYIDYESYGEGDTYKIGVNWQITPTSASAPSRARRSARRRCSNSTSPTRPASSARP